MKYDLGCNELWQIKKSDPDFLGRFFFMVFPERNECISVLQIYSSFKNHNSSIKNPRQPFINPSNVIA
jgi:hypothetical protein